MGTPVSRVRGGSETVTINGVALPEARVRDHMPETLREVADLIGVAAAVRLSQRFGGRRCYIGTNPEGSALEDCVGPDAARALSWYYGAGETTFPRGESVDRYARDQAILKDRLAGMSCGALAEKYRLSERRLWEILAAHRAHETPCGVVPIPESATIREATPRAAGRATSARAGNARAGFDGAR
ncbi:hypothetical protein Thivi_2661 [Thiocystis violascens DSM 198]|uniref:Mor transcription activator domain-containing protein n=2 Tax=Thiocystis violascens TaxID=73141 RepID=I3YC64_THIV6|nr:hypothetical protein Thivi_2661 [Thiocystis violascens DSM 198]